MTYPIPEFNAKYFCIINRDMPIMAAIISSYVYETGKYITMLEYPDVTVPLYDTDLDEFDENYISKNKASEFNIRAKNALNMMGGCDYLILGGLTEEQKSYLTFLDKYDVIEIPYIYLIDSILKEIAGKKEYYICNETDIYNGLFLANKADKMLKIDNNAEKIDVDIYQESGIIVIENISAVSMIIAINYALSVNASISVINKPEINKEEVHDLVEKWKATKESRYFRDLSVKIYSSIENIDFSKFEYATFFTSSVPYSLILNNIIPITYVNNLYQPGFFIFNNIYFERKEQIHSSIVFSPLEFGEDEETIYVADKLKENQYYVKKLIGEKASSYNISYYVREFPFEILHICSHGGEIDGSEHIEKFIDRDGCTHIVEYDEVISIILHEKEELHEVLVVHIWKTFDGFIWKSKELDDQNYPHYIFIDMIAEITKLEVRRGKAKKNIAKSAGIKCAHFNYLGMFNMIAGASVLPFVFNNTCWSWQYISESFLAAGVRGYIGTIWAVNNNVAKNVAETFYDNIFKMTVLDALQESFIHTIGETDENIYMYWGLHFTKLNKGLSIDNARLSIASMLMKAYRSWMYNFNNTNNKSTKENVRRIKNFIFRLLLSDFRREWLTLRFPFF
ncbi:hypothetical protein [uncultured Bacteroides sp.]|uniref:hypothetical protein n=1 Tax=uncultured Bacteroides sp. TaxID=162156 RepID=UPI002AA8C6F9|nr:hypothetical protein [uncultured Bacteroides sp.]